MNPSRASPAPGLLGVCFARVDAAESALAALSTARQRSILKVEHRDAQCRTLLSGAALATREPEDQVLVYLDGHLVDGIAGIEASAQDPAELVRRAYLQWGRASFERLRGNYALALLDRRLPRLFVVRDAAGTKPVYFSVQDHAVFGSSALEALLATRSRAVVDAHALYRYLADGSSSGTTNTLLAGVQALGPAKCLEVAPGGKFEVHPVGQNPERPIATTSFSGAVEELRSRMSRTVDAQSRAARIGVALSGGVDSSGILAWLSAGREGSADRDRIDAFVFAHAHPAIPGDFDERPWAQLAATSANAKLHVVGMQSSSIPEVLSRTVKVQDFPFASPVTLAQAQLFRVAAEAGITAMLSGHGPDVLFAGGHSHAVMRAAHMLREGAIVAAANFLKQACHDRSAGRWRLMLSAAYHAAGTPGSRRRTLPAPWTRRAWFAERGALRRGEGPQVSAPNPMQRLIFEQLYHSIIPTTLQVEECNARAHAIDNRLPYLVSPIMNFAASLPPEFLVSDGGTTKHILRAALRGMVPDPILDRQDSVGFAVPAAPWLRELEPWVDRRLEELREFPFYDKTPADSIWRSVADASEAAHRNALRVWRWISLLEWVKANNVSFA